MVISLLVLLFLPFFFYPPYSPMSLNYSTTSAFPLRGRLLRYRCPEPVLIHHRSCSCALCYKDKREGNRQRNQPRYCYLENIHEKPLNAESFHLMHTGQKETRDIGMASQKDRLSFLNSEITPSWVLWLVPRGPCSPKPNSMPRSLRTRPFSPPLWRSPPGRALTVSCTLNLT